MKPNPNTAVLHDRLKNIISETPAGNKLPSEPELARQLGVSRATLRESMRTFETEGKIRRKQGSGTYVTRISSIIESGLEKLESIENLASKINLPVTMGECQLDNRLATKEEITALNISEGDLVWSVNRVIHAEGRPVAFLIDILPLGIVNKEELTNSFSGSILDLILKIGKFSPQFSLTEINCVTASHDIARSLGIQRGDALMYFCSRLFDLNDSIIAFSHSYFLPGYFRFHLIRRIDSF